MKFSGYTISACIAETRHSVVYRAQQDESGRDVIIKAIGTEPPAPSEIARIRHEYELIHRLEIQGVVRVMEILDTRDYLALVMEDFGGASLNSFAGFPLTLEHFLDLGIRLAEILAVLHNHDISHRNIKPGNVIYNHRSDTVKLTDFGIAAEVARAGEQIYNPEIIEMRLAYMSPEQTGRMNCAADYRSDFYSLGATFYKMLTGSPPFTGEDPMEIIHAHIARQPVPPSARNPKIPEAVSGIVMKLLAKNADQRYQSGAGLVADLGQCCSQLEDTGEITSFEPGQNDVSLRLTLPHGLVGREKELARLCRAFDRAADGGMEIMLVAGEPGIGKSTLVREMDKTVAAGQGFFLTGKYDQMQRHVPYSAAIQAFRGLARRLLSQSDAQIRSWREKLLAALSPNARIITEIIPEIGLIVGDTPEVPELSPTEAHNRFQQVFKDFIRIFADKSHPLVVFLDDVQWADPASVELLQSFSMEAEPGYFLFIGAYRDSEVNAHHPFMHAVEKALRAGRRIETLRLSTLDESQTNHLLSGFLRCDPMISKPLARVIHEKTLGNPFFVIQFLRILHENKQLVLNPKTGWQWDLASIREMQVTDNVVHLLAEKIQGLPEASLEVLKVCACAGSRFDAEIPAQILQKPMAEVIRIMENLAADGFLFKDRRYYVFHHDRIQEAVYSLVPPRQREHRHCQIGRLALAHTPEQEILNNIFYIADQLNSGRRLIDAPSERRWLADLNLKAGTRARNAAAYDTAVNYLQIGTELLPSDCWQSDYRLTYGLYMELMECRYLARDFREAERLFDIIITNAATRIDKARAYALMVVLYTNKRSPVDAVTLGLRALRLFGVRISAKTGSAPVLAALARIKFRLREMRLDKIPDLPMMDDEERVTCHNLIISMATPAYYLNPNLFALLTLRAANENLKYGLTGNSAAVFMALATIFENALGNYKLGYRMGKMALKLNEKLGYARLAGQVHHIFAFFIQHWKKHAKYDINVYSRVYRLCLNTGNLTFAGHSVNAAADCRLMIGDRLDDILEEAEKYRDFMEHVKDPFIEARYRENIQMARCLKGQTKDPLCLSGEGFDEQAHLAELKGDKNFYGVCLSLLYKMKLLYIYGRYEQARRTGENLERYIHVPMGTLVVPEHAFYYALTLAALLRSADSWKKRQYTRIIGKYQRKMKKWARLCPENFQHKHDLIQAEYRAALGSDKIPLASYHAAIRGARQNEYIHEEALACERLANFYRARNAEEEAMMFLQKAHHCWGRWGAAARQKDLEQRFMAPTGRPEPRRFPNAGETAIPKKNSNAHHLDINAVMQVSQTISSEIVLDNLLKKIMHLSVTNAGAQRGALMLETDGKLTIEAIEEAADPENQIAGGLTLDTYNGLAKTVVNYVWRSHEPVILADAAAQGSFTRDPHIAQHRCRSVLCMPILNKGQLTGILYMENNLAADAFTKERLELLGVIASQAAISLENARLFEQATTDGLTRLCVHRYFHFLLGKEIARSRRTNRDLSLVILDIDDFKHFNDTYGHQLGDEVLKQVAGILRENTRTVDIAARYGGEEFVLVLPETGAAEAAAAAGKIRRLVENMKIFHGNDILRVTVSLGAATLPDHAAEKDDLIRAADKALYASKQAGKNQVSRADPEIPAKPTPNPSGTG